MLIYSLTRHSRNQKSGHGYRGHGPLLHDQRYVVGAGCLPAMSFLIVLFRIFHVRDYKLRFLVSFRFVMKHDPTFA
uniref:Uncharacterized protein n=1 Tax=Candidatus Kentrum sp. DK TaxID=2126562 RepID=A0A450S8K5_9GAMM|nr:MAG: hypothetical protein BECKDK2373C_GA0170839_102121 [Candidatus Kentron sp. DK]